jgi:hypothetical protein
MSDEKRTPRNWGARLSMPDEPLTLEETRTLAALSTADRTLEMRDILTDLRNRLQRIEMYLEDAQPGYAEHAERTRRRQEQPALPSNAHGVPHAV